MIQCTRYGFFGLVYGFVAGVMRTLIDALIVATEATAGAGAADGVTIEGVVASEGTATAEALTAGVLGADACAGDAGVDVGAAEGPLTAGVQGAKVGVGADVGMRGGGRLAGTTSLGSPKMFAFAAGGAEAAAAEEVFRLAKCSSANRAVTCARSPR